jgi:hypothetical protein
MITKPLKESLLELIELSKEKVVKNQAVIFNINDNIKTLLESELE